MISMFIKIFRAYTLIIMNTPCAPNSSISSRHGLQYTSEGCCGAADPLCPVCKVKPPRIRHVSPARPADA